MNADAEAIAEELAVALAALCHATGDESPEEGDFIWERADAALERYAEFRARADEAT